MLVNDPAFAAQAGAEYFVNSTGPLTAAVEMIVVEMNAFEQLSQSRPDLLSNETVSALRAQLPPDWPEIELLNLDILTDYIRNSNDQPQPGENNYVSLAASLLATTSRGNVTISSSNAAEPPVFNPAWLTTSEDQALAVATIKRLREIAQHLTINVGEYLPGGNVTTDEGILEYIQQGVTPIFHAAATCKMGKADNDMAVVDSRAKVFGVSGLRVVAASALPFLPPGHPQASIYMLAKKIVDDMKSGR